MGTRDVPLTTFGQLSFDGERVTERSVLFVDAFHLHETITRCRFLQDACVDLINLLLQLLTSLIGRQVTKVLLGFGVSGQSRLRMLKSFKISIS
jgi:hypothetical protein